MLLGAYVVAGIGGFILALGVVVQYHFRIEAVIERLANVVEAVKEVGEEVAAVKEVLQDKYVDEPEASADA